MTSYTAMSFDSCHHQHQQARYTHRLYAQTTTTKTRNCATTNQSFQSYSSLVPIPSIDLCENLLYDIKVIDEGGSATSSSYVNSSEHYDNTCINTYDNPIGYLDNFTTHQSLLHLPYDNCEFYRETIETRRGLPEKRSSTHLSRNPSPVLVYLENKNLALCVTITCLLLLLLVGLGIFLFDKLSQPIALDPMMDYQLNTMNSSDTTSSVPSPSTPSPSPSSSISVTEIFTELRTTNPIENVTMALFSCAADRWGAQCEHICKPCGPGFCHPRTGQCICPADRYGEFCDLWRVDDKPSRGDMKR